MRAHSEHAHAALEGLTGCGKLKARNADLDNATALRMSMNAAAPPTTPSSSTCAAPTADAGRADAPRVKVCDVADKITSFAVRGDPMCLRTHRDGPRSSVVRTALAAPDFKAAETVVPAGEGVIEGMVAASDGLCVTPCATAR